MVWIAIYTLGYFDFSVAWLATPLLLSVMRFATMMSSCPLALLINDNARLISVASYLHIRSQWKRERDAKLSAARHAALTNEKVMIESRIRVEDLPTWVFFPDKVRCTYRPM